MPKSYIISNYQTSYSTSSKNILFYALPSEIFGGSSSGNTPYIDARIKNHTGGSYGYVTNIYLKGSGASGGYTAGTVSSGFTAITNSVPISAMTLALRQTQGYSEDVSTVLLTATTRNPTDTAIQDWWEESAVTQYYYTIRHNAARVSVWSLSPNALTFTSSGGTKSVTVVKSGNGPTYSGLTGQTTVLYGSNFSTTLSKTVFSGGTDGFNITVPANTSTQPRCKMIPFVYVSGSTTATTYLIVSQYGVAETPETLTWNRRLYFSLNTIYNIPQGGTWNKYEVEYTAYRQIPGGIKRFIGSGVAAEIELSATCQTDGTYTPSGDFTTTYPPFIKTSNRTLRIPQYFSGASITFNAKFKSEALGLYMDGQSYTISVPSYNTTQSVPLYFGGDCSQLFIDDYGRDGHSDLEYFAEEYGFDDPQSYIDEVIYACDEYYQDGGHLDYGTNVFEAIGTLEWEGETYYMYEGYCESEGNFGLVGLLKHNMTPFLLQSMSMENDIDNAFCPFEALGNVDNDDFTPAYFVHRDLTQRILNYDYRLICVR